MASAEAIWHTRPDWTRYAHSLLRYYSRRSDFHLRIKPGQKKPLACVVPSLKRVEVTTDFPVAKSLLPSPRLERRALREMAENPTGFWLNGFIAHEAAHILFSRKKPEANVLGWLWNALEDERIERLMAAEFPGRELYFDGMGDVMITETIEERTRREEQKAAAERRHQQGEAPLPEDVLRDGLTWRWLHDHAGGRRYHPHLALPEPVFARLRPLVESAWEARTSDDVRHIASEILALFSIPEGAEVPKGLDPLDLPGGAVPGGKPSGSKPSGSEPSGNEPPEDGSSHSGSDLSREDAEPQQPDYDPDSVAARAGRALLEGLQVEAAALSKILQPIQRSRRARSNRSRGRFDYRRYAAGEERIYRTRPEKPDPPRRLSVLLDMSFSMAQNSLFGDAKRCVALVSRAAELQHIGLVVVPFNKYPGKPLCSSEIGHERLRTRLSELNAEGRTKLTPALSKVLGRRRKKSAPAPGGLHVVLLISDGKLHDADRIAAEQVYRQGMASGTLLVVPILMGEALEAVGSADDICNSPEVYRSIFGRYAAVDTPRDLPEVVRRWLQHALH